VTIILAGVLFFLAALHLIWALGIWWPIRDEPSLARAAVGAKGIHKMPPKSASFLVFIALSIAAFWPWMSASLPRGIYMAGLAGLALVFLGRGLLTYTAFWRKICPEEPFATLDKKYYGPLCFTIGAAFALIFWLAL